MKRDEELALLKVSILAMRADGIITDNENEAIKKHIEEFAPTNDEYKCIDKCWLGNTSISDISEVVKELGIEDRAFKRATCVLLNDGMNQREHEFLREFAEFLEFDEEKCRELYLDVTNEMKFDFLVTNEEPEGVKSIEGLDKTILKYSISGGGIGLTPIPFVSDFILLTPLQMKMVYDIGKHYGYELDKKSINEFSVLIGVAFGLKVVGSIAKVIPVVGSLIGAAVAFSGTYAMGKTAEVYFKQGRKIVVKELKETYDKFKEEGEKLYKKVKDQVKKVDVDKIKNKFK